MLKRFTPVIVVLVLCWVVFVANHLLWNGRLNQFGIVPRHLESLPAVLWAPLLHGSFKHLAANTVPFLILGGIICAHGRGEFWTVAVGGAVLGGALTWLFGREASHIGASGLIFCFFGYLASQAYFRRTFGALIISLLCLVCYGGMLRGLLPSSPAVSWESHAAGLAAGIVMAWAMTKSRSPLKNRS